MRIFGSENMDHIGAVFIQDPVHPAFKCGIEILGMNGIFIEAVIGNLLLTLFGYLEAFYKSNKEIAAEFVRYPTAESSNNTKFHVGDRITYNGETYFVDRIPPCGTYINAHPTSIDFTDAFGTDKRISIKKKNWDAIELKPYSKDEMKVFDKVVVRGDDGYWVCATFSHNTDDGKFVTDAAVANECLPFNEYTEYLIGQNIDYNGFFKILFF